MSEVKALKDDINAQIKMAKIFADGLEKSNVQEGNSHEDVKYSRYAPKNRFEKALSKQDWVRFNSAIVNKKQSTGLRIGDNGVFLYNEDDIYNSKLICYDEIGNHIEVTAVYDLQNYDRNIHDKNNNIAKFIVNSVRSGLSEEFRNKILSNYNELSRTVFRKYNARTGRFVNIRRKNNTNGKSNGNQSRRGNNNQENKGNKIQLNDRNNVKLSIDELGETLPGTKFSIYESGGELQNYETQVNSENFKEWFGDWKNNTANLILDR